MGGLRLRHFGFILLHILTMRIFIVAELMAQHLKLDKSNVLVYES